MKKILLTGGGTAGHIMPHIALLPELKKHFKYIEYIGTNGLEKSIISQYKEIKFHEINAVKLVRKLTAKNLLIPIKLLNSIKQCRRILKSSMPDIVFSKGGFVSVPVVIAAHQLGIPIVSHESDISMGLANKIILRYCNVMCTSFKETSKNKKCKYTGSPIRESLFNGNEKNILSKCDFHPNKPKILFMGGSLGAKAINDFVFNNIDNLTEKYNICHIVGKNNIKHINKSNYYQIEFTNNIEDCFKFADIVICRSGANTIFELLALSKPMILIPLPKSQSRGDQIANAKNFEENGFAYLIKQENLSLENLNKVIKKARNNRSEILINMKKSPIKNANKNILNILLNQKK